MFCDASEKAASTVSHMVNMSKRGREEVLVAAKIKVAPNKPISLPRMELQAVVMDTRLAHVKSQHSLTSIIEWYWTDSPNVLWWIRSFLAHSKSSLLTESER